MQKSRFQHLCDEAQGGQDAFVRHPDSNEEGMVTGCVMKSGHMIVKTTEDQTRCWDYKECEDLEHPKPGPMTF